MARAYLVLAKLKKLGHVAMLDPPNERLQGGGCHAGFGWVRMGQRFSCPPAEHGPQKLAQSIAVDHLLAGDYLWAGEL
jgi:hypothetical protein